VPALIDRLVDGVTDEPSPEVDVLVARVFTELVAAGACGEALAVRPRLPRLHDLLAQDAESDMQHERRRTALDALFSEAMLALHQGAAQEAADGFATCARLATAHDDDHARQISELARRHEALAVEHLAPTGGGPT
jgi:hypothetical protein